MADGHAGCEAAQIAIEHVIEELAPSLLASCEHPLSGRSSHWEERARELALSVHERILRDVAILAGYPPRTTLALALARADVGALAWLSVGDSLIFRVDAQRATPLGGDPQHVAYLGSPREDREQLIPGVAAGTLPLTGTRAVLLATDGLSEEGIGVSEPCQAALQAIADASDARTPDLRPLNAARRLAEIANQSHRDRQAGDNIATAVAWLGE